MDRKSLCFALVWVGLVVGGFGFFLTHGEQAAAPTPIAASWPKDLPVALDPSRLNLVLAAHPRCPCTEATLDELIQILTRVDGRDRLRVTVLFTVPANETDAAWRDSATERTARSIPGVTVVLDPDGKAAARLGAKTSGEALLFDGAGRLLFSGGITGSRGHEGPNAGEAAVIALASGAALPESARRAPVYGCSLVGASDARLEAGL